jgi:hypothetical protein
VSKPFICFVLCGIAAISALATADLLPRRTVTVVVTVPVLRPPPKPVRRVTPRPALHLPRKVRGEAAFTPPKPKVEPKPKLLPTGPPRATPSLYERTTSPSILRAQGCRAAQASTSGIVVLDFGRLAYANGGYGTLLFDDHFASNTAITWGLRAYALGYSQCLPKRSAAHIALARGTSNFAQSLVPTTYVAGRLWATETLRLAQYLRRHHFTHVEAAAADDVEPAWDRTFKRTREFFDGYRAAHTGYLLYDYGSLDGGLGAIWSFRQAYYVAGGMRYARAVPEIYNRTMAEEWAVLNRRAVELVGKPIPIVGVMTQYREKCRRCGYSSAQANEALVRQLAGRSKSRVRSLAAVTNIGPARREPWRFAFFFGACVLPGHTPVTRSKPVAPARSISALTPPNTAPSTAAAPTTSAQPRFWSVASGESLSCATSFQICLKTAPARRPPSTLNRRPKGL